MASDRKLDGPVVPVAKPGQLLEREASAGGCKRRPERLQIGGIDVGHHGSLPLRIRTSSRAFHRRTARLSLRRALTMYAFAPLRLERPSSRVIESSGTSSP